MTRAGPRWWGVGLAAVAALLFAAPAMAAPSNTYTVPAASLTFSVAHGTHGYSVHFSEGERNRHRHFKLIASGHGARVEYLLEGGRRRGDGVDADLGHRGRFALRFVPIGRVRTLGLGHFCEGKTGHWQRGYLVGVARLHGERGYTEVSSHRLGAVAESWPRFRCRYHERTRKPKVSRARVIAYRREVGFGAVLAPTSAAGPPAAFRAWDYSGRGNLRISREVRVTAPEPTFAFPGGPKLPEEVSVTPPAPFTGTASFTRTSESTFTWAGDLAVQFPGTGPIHLAGPRYGVRVCAADRCMNEGSESERPN